ncbi:MAG: hypothetical protein MUO26_04895 [Methanotrichaceae archaeon]|nr:hypothetical protein [Methanotrichaceae archaeon]
MKNRLIILIYLVFSSLIFIHSYHSEALETRVYEGMDIFIQYPTASEVKTSGSQSSGNLSIYGLCNRITLNWTTDPGISPSKILDAIKETYESSGINVLSSEHGEIQMQRQKATTLNLVYEFQGYTAEKRFAAWNSSRSNRIFLASISGCEANIAPHTLDRIVESFLDTMKGEMIKFEPKPDMDAWSIVLGDLLSSYHYKDPRILPPRNVSLQVLHSLLQNDESYQLDSQEVINVDEPALAFARADAVMALLLQKGYKVRRTHKGNEIGIGVLDPSGQWQPVSINTANPESSVGVLVDEAYEAVSYQDSEDTSLDKTHETGKERVNEFLEKDAESPGMVNLNKPMNIDRDWKEGLETLLESFDYNKTYQEGFFDCSNTAQMSWSLLKNYGYDVRLMMGWKKHPLGEHLWIVVTYPNEHDSYVAIETANTDENKKLNYLGKIIMDEKYHYGIMYNSSTQYSRLHPEEGMWLS